MFVKLHSVWDSEFFSRGYVTNEENAFPFQILLQDEILLAPQKRRRLVEEIL